MPRFGLIGDSSLYVKSGRHVRRVGSQLRESLGTTDLWYRAVANAGVKEILHMLKNTSLTFATLGISYFGNDITEGRIRPEVQAAWQELMNLVEEKAQHVVFVVGGSYWLGAETLRKYADKAKQYGITPQYDENLAQVRTWLSHRGHTVHNFQKQLGRWQLNGDGIHWDVDVAEELCATWADLLSPPRLLATTREVLVA
ncbi:unnamed protein product [Symbiodinium necroappetens]|uniref:SGNH hydrolase-type esterase domain-containing protein n=1 Tax=Symbiodinium necroappetens TaxID=1628268 RepID=A0A812TWH5_9DINO|nr:unnamed protein product [Symbiodinium necroappetens]